VLYALSDSVRLDIVRQFSVVDSLACGHFQIGKPKSHLSHHFRPLRESGVVSPRGNRPSERSAALRARFDIPGH
jgi:DNA-binding transcriptional ArsR family regulator